METEYVQVTADTTVVTKLGITTRPITDSIARIIADTASTGTALSSTLETKHNIAFFDVKEQVGILIIDVNVRVSDGAVITISDLDDGDRHR